MGSNLSALLRRKPAVCPPLPPLLRLPPELVLMICGHLSTDRVSTCSLAITCKRFFLMLVHDGRLLPLDTSDRNSFLCLLERDLGDRFYLCCECSKLRRFYKSWGPTRPDSYQNCHRLLKSSLQVGSYRLAYHHLRLVMHHHRSGGTKGIPLKNLNQTVAVATLPQEQDKAIWRQDWSARIINGELFLSARHTLRASDKTNLRRALDMGFYTICTHTCISPWWISSCPAPLRGSIEGCCEVLGSCNRCLTDYILTIEAPREPAKHSAHGEWRVSVTTYHQVGDGTSRWDRKWLAYVQFLYTLDLCRNPADYPPGSIRETWNSENL